MTQENEQQHKRLRFSLRAMLVLFAFLALLMAAGGQRLFVARTQRAAMDSISRMEAVTGFVYDWQADGRTIDANGSRLAKEPPCPSWALKYLGEDVLFHVVEIEICQGRVQDDELAPLSKFPKLRSLNLLAVDVTGPGLKHISKCSGLTELLINDCPLSDLGLTHIRDLTSLEHLRLCCTNVSDDGLQYIKHLKNLQHLDLAYTRVGDDGLRYLAELTQLRSLILAGTKVTDNGLMHLYRLQNLAAIALPRTESISEVAVDELKSMLPKCRVSMSPTRE